jgi:hypothetical protein
MRQKEVECVVPRYVPREVVKDYTCTVMVPEYKNEQRTCTVMVPEYKNEQRTCTVMVPEYKNEQRTCTVMVPEYKNEQRTCTVYVPRPREVEREVVSCKMVPVQMTDGCGGTYTCCKPVQEVQKVKCTITECVPEQRQYTVQVCVPRTEQRQYTVQVCVPRAEQRQYTVQVCVPRAEQRQYTVQVCYPKPVQKNYQCRYTVYDCVQDKVKKMVPYCEMEAYQVTIKVPVCTPCCQ